ncbi:hypothetical protein [Streptomyces sp. NPDC048737]|uniref:hypothetical protein n=1 Tax=unclassified Streptomyces TaxID=2593676 RepID=UPI00342F47DD
MISPDRNRRLRVLRLGAAFLIAVLSLAGTGCSSTVDRSENASAADESASSKSTTLGLEEAREKAKAVSSQIYDMIGIKEGKVTEPGPGIAPCEEDPERLYSTVHPWSVYGVSEDELRDGFQRLKGNLPEQGWKIVEYGPNNSKSKTLEITADSKKEPFSLNAELWVSSPATGTEKDPKILVNLTSGCFRAPEGANLDQEF